MVLQRSKFTRSLSIFPAIFLISDSLLSFKVHQSIAVPVRGTAASTEEHQGKLSSSVAMNNCVGMSDVLWPKKQYTSFTVAKPAKYETVYTI